MNNSTIARTLARVIRLSVIAALLIGLLAVTQPARATNYVVTTAANSGPGSLREAITNANNNASADIITFAIATNGIPIILAGAAGEDANVSGDLDILNGGDLTIQGNGAANTIIDGGGIDRVFHVCPGGGCANTVTLRGVTIRNGSVAGYGGGIYNAAGTTTVDSSTVSANTATNSGGGITNYGTLNVQRSTIGGAGTGNTGYTGGGIFNWGTLNVQNGSTVSANTATMHGGGIFNRATLNVQKDSTIGGGGAGNTATNDGGGIYNETGGTTTVDGSTVSANTANYGGGIYNKSTLNIQKDSTIGGAGAGNQATNDGGGIYNAAGTTTVNGSTVSANIAFGGGGIYNTDTLNVQNGSTIGEAGAGNIAAVGGGIYNAVGTTTVDGSTVSANTAFGGGGIYNIATLNVQNGSTIGGAGAGNTATYGGGGIYNDDGTTTVTGSRILNNTAVINGGGVFNEWDVAWATSVTGSCIVGNSATSFFNNQSSQQTATGNWWGAATGPNTPGADTVGGNVDTSGYLTEPILGCTLYVYLPLVLK